MGTEMRIKKTSIDTCERAMGTHLGFPAGIELMSFQIAFVSGAVPTSVTREMSSNSQIIQMSTTPHFPF